MGLRAVHIGFIFISTVFALWFSMSSFRQYLDGKATSDFVLGALSAMAAAALCVYFGWFIKKSKKLVLAFSTFFLMSASKPAFACATCFGDQNSVISQSARAGVQFLLVVILTVLVAFAVLFVRWIRRAQKLGH